MRRLAVGVRQNRKTGVSTSGSAGFDGIVTVYVASRIAQQRLRKIRGYLF
jgi:hypothetical protein